MLIQTICVSFGLIYEQIGVGPKLQSCNRFVYLNNYSQNISCFLKVEFLLISKPDSTDQMEPYKIFIVEDDRFYAEMLSYHLSLNPDYEVKTFFNGKDCLTNLYQKPDVITLDYSLPDKNGGEVLKKIREVDNEVQVIIISGQEDVGIAVDLLKKGAYDYIVKDADTKDRLWNTVSNIRKNQNLRREIDTLKEEIGQKYDFERSIIGKSEAIKKVYSLIEKASKTNITVSITGETGTGKELVAKAIHYNSARKKKPFVAVNVGAIPRELIESELFGHEKGAFTGAVARRVGKFEEANGGTIFLDEIGDLDLTLQVKLLRVLQEKEITRVGSNEVVSYDARVIVATHKNLAEEARKGNFREDLYYRLLGLPITLPALRERDKDILVIAKHIIDQFCEDNKIKKKSLSSEAQQKLLSYPFPGNVRELKAVIELACVLADDTSIDHEHINLNSINTTETLLTTELTLQQYTQRIIQHYLDKYQYNVLKVAEKLDIGKSTIYRMAQNEELVIK
jgi:two-component system response regulator AtoC